MFNKTVLSNNLRVLTIPMKEARAVTLYLIVKTGSRYEDRQNSGISHFLEHLFFKGTKKRMGPSSIAKELDSIGASYNAFTSEEMTGFYIQAESSKFSFICDVLFDLLQNSQFPSKEIEKERGVILEEMKMHQDTPFIYIFDLYKNLLYGDTSLGRLTVGSKETIQNLQRDNFVQYKKDYYKPQNILVAAAGAISEKDKKLLNSYGRKPQGKGQNKPEIFIDKQSQPEVLLNQKNTDQAHIALGVKAVSRSSEKRFAAEVLNVILGATMSSRLFRELREKRGLCYHVASDVWYFADTGSLVVYTGVLLSKIDDAIKLIIKEFNALKKHGVGEDELDKAKENLKGKLALKLESSYNTASYYADQELLLEKIQTPEQEIAAIEKVSARDVQELAKEIFVPEELNLAVIGPYKDDNQFKKLLEEK